jgi:predicted Zn-dependent protease
LFVVFRALSGKLFPVINRQTNTTNFGKFPMKTTVTLRTLLAATMAVTLLGSCATNPVTGQRQFNLMSESEEIATGKQADGDVKKEYGVYNDPTLQAYVNEIGQKLARSSQRANLEWHFTVVDSPEINAFALPGGYIYVTRGIMAHLNSEAELAGVIGHEIGHVTARHGAQAQSQGTIAQVGAVAAEILGQVYGGVQGLGEVAGQVGQAVILKHGREHELQADQLGAEYLSRGGYNAKTMIAVIGTLKAQELAAAERARVAGKTPQRMPDWLSSHPSNDQRLNDIVNIAAKYPATPGDGNRNTYLQRTGNMSFGDSREQGITRGNNFYHEPLNFTITAPQGWKFQNSPDKLVVVNAAGDAALIMASVTGAGANPNEIFKAVFKPDSGNVSNTSVNGFPATSFKGTSQGKPVQGVLMAYGGQQFMFVPQAKDDAAMQRSRNEMSAALNGFHAMTATEKQAARPYTLRTVSAQRGATFAALARTSPLGQFAEQELRLLNGLYPSGEPAQGQLIKIVE